MGPTFKIILPLLVFHWCASLVPGWALQSSGALSDGVAQPSRIEAVREGMKKETVLAGLAENYKLTKENLNGGYPFEAWVVKEKQGQEADDWHEILFYEGVVKSVMTHLEPSLSGDAVSLARRLMNILDLHSSPPASSDEIVKLADKALNRKVVSTKVVVQQIRLGDREKQEMIFVFPNVTFCVTIQSVRDSRPIVHLEMVR